MLMIRNNTTKICPKFVGTEKDLDTMIHLSSRQTGSPVTIILQRHDGRKRLDIRP